VYHIMTEQGCCPNAAWLGGHNESCCEWLCAWSVTCGESVNDWQIFAMVRVGYQT
jgi:hypothetical protein